MPIIINPKLSKPVKTIPISKDGNCLFRSFSKIFFDDENYHQGFRVLAIRSLNIYSYQFCNLLGINTIGDYIKNERMEHDGVWGTDTKIFANLYSPID